MFDFFFPPLGKKFLHIAIIRAVYSSVLCLPFRVRDMKLISNFLCRRTRTPLARRETKTNSETKKNQGFHLKTIRYYYLIKNASIKRYSHSV